MNDTRPVATSGAACTMALNGTAVMSALSWRFISSEPRWPPLPLPPIANSSGWLRAAARNLGMVSSGPPASTIRNSGKCTSCVTGVSASLA